LQWLLIANKKYSIATTYFPPCIPLCDFATLRETKKDFGKKNILLLDRGIPDKHPIKFSLPTTPYTAHNALINDHIKPKPP
jgi:hypothetical protein